MSGIRFPIYLDNQATTAVDPRVLEAMLPFFSNAYGNAASKQHAFGWEAEAAVHAARKQVAALLGAESDEIIFTSGATESINLAIKGIAEAFVARGNHIITAATEHRAVLDTCAYLEHLGFRVTYLRVDDTGLVSPRDLADALTKETILVSIMAANNEIGTLAPLEELGRICREHGVVFHTDATQAAGKVPLDVRRMCIDVMSFSAHKMYGPKGIGALYIASSSPAAKLAPQMHGGGHERGFRSGTLNVPAIAGFGSAARLALTEMESDASRTAALRDALVRGLVERCEGIRTNGHPVLRLPNNANITFPGVRADRLMMDMKEIALSSGSACSSASAEPSHVLRAIGLRDEEIRCSVRFGLGRFTTPEEVEFTIHRVSETVRRILAPTRIGDPIHHEHPVTLP